MKKPNTACCSRWLSKNGFALAVFCMLALTMQAGIYKPNAGNITPNANIEQLKKGREIYIGKCSSCHALVQPEKYDAHKWDSLVHKMEKRAKIDNIEKELILKYVTKGVK